MTDLPFVTTRFSGLFYPLTIDGRMVVDGPDDDPVFPASVVAVPSFIESSVDTLDSGSQSFQPSGSGHPDVSDRWVINVVFGSISGSMRSMMSSIRVSGRSHLLTFWKPEPVAWTGSGSRNQFYLPHFRRNAPQIYPDLSYRGIPGTTEFFSSTATVGDDPLTVVYRDGPILDIPEPGEIAVARIPDSTGHVQVMTHDVVPKLSILELIYFPVYLTRMTTVQIEMVDPASERHSYQFTEK